MSIYNNPEITIINEDNLVFRDTPYELNFTITAPTLINDVTEEINYSNSKPLEDTTEWENGMMYEYDINKSVWGFNEKNEVLISKLKISGENNDVLVITGKKPVIYDYKIYFNDQLIKETLGLTDNVEDSVNILSSYFNNFVDGIVTIEIIYGDNLIEIKNYNLQLINTKPNILFGDIINNKLDLTITDEESDPIKINIKLNGKNYYPLEGGFSDYINTPYFYSTYFTSDELNVDPNDFANPNNIVTVTVIDKYGAETQMHKSFVGEFIGIMFVNEEDNFYSDDTNNYVDDANILMEQYLGNIKAGTQGEKKTTYLLNKTRFKLTNIKLTLNTTGIPDKTYIRISKNFSTNFSNMSDELNFDDLVLDIGDKLPFYIQANTEILSLGGGYYYIDVIADPVD